MIQQKKIDIQKLFRRTKNITYEDPKIELVLQKPNIGERDMILEEFGKVRDAAILEIRDSHTAMKEVSAFVNTLKTEQKIDYLLTNEEGTQRGMMDIVPIGNRAEMTPEEIKAKEEEFIIKWREKRRIDFAALTENKLVDEVATRMIDYRSLIKAGETYSKRLISIMVRDEQGNKVFPKLEDVSAIPDEKFFSWLKIQTSEFYQNQTPQEIRKEAENKDFLSPTE